MNEIMSAGELREMGFMGLPEHVPDCAWVPRHSILYLEPIAGPVAVTLRMEFTEPFRWVTGTFIVQAP